MELQRKRALEGLAQKSIDDTRKRNMERTRQQMENFKEARGKLSTLSLIHPVPLIDDTEKSEYWKYLS
jgi:uracil-DNA glycosylase